MNPQKIEQPKQAPIPGIQARVFTMPERYRHGAEATVHEPAAKASVPPPTLVQTPAIPAPKAPPKPTAPKKNISTTKKLLLVGGVVLILLAAGGFFLIALTPDASPSSSTATSTPSTTRPEPEPESESEPESEPEPEEEPEVFPTEIIPGTDTDSDGLTDTEEELVYDTNPRRPDTDADGFLDGNEVFHGYNPAGTAPGTLVESELVELQEGTYEGTNYAFFYPSAWDVKETDGEWVLDAQTGEGFRISFAQGELPQGDERTTKTDLLYVLSDDQLTAYVQLDSFVLTMQYDTGIKTKVDYLQTFQMMLNTVTYDSSANESESAEGGTEDSTEESPEGSAGL